MAGVQTCKWERHSAGCASEFGASLVSRWFGLTAADIEAKCGRFVRGKNKGGLRGWLVWAKCVEGGWSYPLQCVIRPGTTMVHFCETFEKSADLLGLPTDEFMVGAVRVDHAANCCPECGDAGLRAGLCGDCALDHVQFKPPACRHENKSLWADSGTPNFIAKVFRCDKCGQGFTQIGTQPLHMVPDYYLPDCPPVVVAGGVA